MDCYPKRESNTNLLNINTGMTFKEFYHLEEKGMLSKALLGLSLLGTGANAAPKFELPDPPSVVAQKNQSDFNVVAATLVMEAGGETDPNAMIGIYNVLKNRSLKSGDSMSEEALKPSQFSCWNTGKVSKKIKSAQSHPKWDEAMKIVRSSPKDITGGATHYHVFQGKRKVNPSWNRKAETTKIIGDHVFLKNVD